MTPSANLEDFVTKKIGAAVEKKGYSYHMYVNTRERVQARAGKRSRAILGATYMQHVQCITIYICLQKCKDRLDHT